VELVLLNVIYYEKKKSWDAYEIDEGDGGT